MVGWGERGCVCVCVCVYGGTLGGNNLIHSHKLTLSPLPGSAQNC